VQLEFDGKARMSIRDDKSPLSAQEELLQFSIFLYDVLRGEHHDIEPELSITMSVANKIKDYPGGPEAPQDFPLVILNILKYCFNGPH